MSRARDLASRTGNVIETLTSVCDGSVVTVPSGTYTFPNVTGQQGSTDSFADINGSVLSYTPPPGTKQVKYTFNFASYWNTAGAHAINYYKFFIAGTEVTNARHNRSAQYVEDRSSFEWTINIGGSTNNSTGRQATWTTAKELKMQFRRYGGSNAVQLHGTVYWDNGASQFSMPTLTIEAIA